MPTVAREIDALGGVANSSSDYDQAFHEGYDKALSLAEPIAENADALIKELMECVVDVLHGHQTIAKWAASAQTLIDRARSHRDR